MFNELAKEIHKNAKEHGWWEEERPFADIIALCHSELSEALEEYRDEKSDLYFNNEKPEGIAVELADCIIRILDYCGKEDIDVDGLIPMNNFIALRTIEKMSDDNETLPELITGCHESITFAYLNDKPWDKLIECICRIVNWCKKNDIDVIETIKIKHEYNRTRSYKHGGKVI